MARSLVLTVVPIVCNIITLVLLCLVIFSGFGNRLRQFYWLQTYSGDFDIPAALSGSQYMDALSDVTGIDYVGEDITAESLGLPEWTSTHLLTECDVYEDGRVVDCEEPRFGFHFNPADEFELEATGLVSDDLTTAISHYSRASRWVAGAFIASAVASLLNPVEAFFSPLFASFTAVLCTLFLLTGSITATAVFKKLVDAFNADMNDYGISAQLGVIPIVFGFVGTFLSFVAAVCYVSAYRRQQRGDGRRGFDDKLPGGGVSLMHPGLAGGPVGAGADGDDGVYDSNATRSKAGLFNRAGGGGAAPSHKYVQIEEQHVGTFPAGGGDLGEEGERRLSPSTAPGSPDGIRPSRLDEDWGAPDEYAGAAGAGAGAKTSAGPGASIPLMALGGNKQTKDLNTAYEPYSNPQ